MIITEFYETRPDGVNLYKTYSDIGMQIIQKPTNIMYNSAIDIENSPYTYIESDEKIPFYDEEEVDNDGNNDETGQS